MRVRAAQRLRVEHARQNEVGRIVNRTGDLGQPSYHRDISYRPETSFGFLLRVPPQRLAPATSTWTKWRL